MDRIKRELGNAINLLRAISVSNDDVERMAAAKIMIANASALCDRAEQEKAKIIKERDTYLAELSEAAVKDDTEPAKEPTEGGGAE